MGENEANEVAFDLTLWKNQWPEVIGNVIVQRPGETTYYIANTSMEENLVVWPITSAETEIAGIGQFEVRGTVGEVIAKSVTGTFVVKQSISGEEGEAPDPYKGWIDQILAAGAQAENSADAAAGSASQAASSASSAGSSATSAASSAEAAQNALSSVETAATDGVASINQAKTDAITAITQEGNEQYDRLTGILPVPGSGDDGKVVTARSGQFVLEQPSGAIDDSVVTDDKTWSSLNIINMLCPAFELSGSMVTCDPVAGYPLSLSLNIDAVQNGQPSAETSVPINGFSSVELRTGGKNLWSTGNIETPFYNYLLPQESYPAIYESLTSLKPGLQYRIGGSVSYQASGQSAPEGIAQILITYSSGSTVTIRSASQTGNVLSEDISSVRIYTGSSSTSGTRELTNIVLEQTSGTVGTYEDFSGETKSIDLGRTVYGGTLNVVTGELTVTHENIASYNGEDVGDDWISSTGELTTGAQVVYKTSSPQTYNIGQNKILAIAGTNVIYCNSGDVSVSGRTVSSNVPVYSGTYSVDPMVTSQVLNTGGKYLEQDVLINTIPLNETPNDSGGVTITIGGE